MLVRSILLFLISITSTHIKAADQELPFIPGKHDFHQEIENEFKLQIDKRIKSTSEKKLREEAKNTTLNRLAKDEKVGYYAKKFYLKILKSQDVYPLFENAEWTDFDEITMNKLKALRKEKLSNSDGPIAYTLGIQQIFENNKDIQLNEDERIFLKAWYVTLFSFKQVKLNCLSHKPS